MSTNRVGIDVVGRDGQGPGSDLARTRKLVRAEAVGNSDFGRTKKAVRTDELTRMSKKPIV
jgi:hypothetical protein